MKLKDSHHYSAGSYTYLSARLKMQHLKHLNTNLSASQLMSYACQTYRNHCGFLETFGSVAVSFSNFPFKCSLKLFKDWKLEKNSRNIFFVCWEIHLYLDMLMEKTDNAMKGHAAEWTDFWLHLILVLSFWDQILGNNTTQISPREYLHYWVPLHCILKATH